MWEKIKNSRELQCQKFHSVQKVCVCVCVGGGGGGGGGGAYLHL